MEKTAHDIVIRPVVTEASMAGVAHKKYTFEVLRTANKQEIAEAVEQLFSVKVDKVNTLNVRGRFKRQGIHTGYTSKWKKAIVTLTEKSKGIDFFESMS
ncbi:MAG: 50S ribosomal protein L23 [Acetanaerobacterium sp.]